MRAKPMVVAALFAGGATALGVSACGSSSSDKSASSAPSVATDSPRVSTAAPGTSTKPATIRVSVNGRTVTIRLAKLGFGYCRANPRTCGAVRSGQEKYLTPNQLNAVKAARKRVKAEDAAAAAAASQPAPQPAPVPQPAPAPEPPPSSGGGGTTTG
jgi:hypothetical protein